MPRQAKSSGRKDAPKSKKSSTKVGKTWKSQHTHLFNKDARNFKVGRDILPPRDLSRFVKWPRYVRLQRQRAILKKRLKVPPAINQFAKTVDKSQASTLFRMLSHYRPESPKDKKERLHKAATAEAKGETVAENKKQKVIKFGLNHVTQLVENKKAKLVIIAHDVDPIELVLWLPALCRKMDVPYCIVKGKARLGHMVYKKTASVIALTEVNKEDDSRLNQLVGSFRIMYNDNTDFNKWGHGELGIKSNHVIAKRAKALARELASGAR